MFPGLDHIVVHFARAEDESLHIKRIISWTTALGYHSLEVRVADERLQLRLGHRVLQQGLGRKHDQLKKIFAINFFL